MKPDKIRVIAICVFRNGNRILAAEGYDTIKQQVFYRPLGGTIEFGELSQDTVRRELLEEINAEVSDLEYIGTLETIFIFEGQKGHEIIQVYDGKLVDTSLYKKTFIQGLEAASPFRAVWVDFTQLGPQTPPLYPVGLIQLLEKTPA